jgi:F-type H+-transporting ATPase subunit b
MPAPRRSASPRKPGRDQADLDDATAKADARSPRKPPKARKRIAEIRANAMQSVKEVAQATAGELVSAMGGKADDKAISSAVSNLVKG